MDKIENLTQEEMRRYFAIKGIDESCVDFELLQNKITDRIVFISQILGKQVWHLDMEEWRISAKTVYVDRIDWNLDSCRNHTTKWDFPYEYLLIDDSKIKQKEALKKKEENDNKHKENILELKSSLERTKKEILKLEELIKKEEEMING